MKKIMLASVLAIAALSASLAPAMAETIIIRKDDHRGPPRHMHRFHPKHCVVEKKIRWDHGRRVVIEKRICR